MDWIRVVEAAYDLEQTHHDVWVAHVEEALGDALGGEIYSEIYSDGAEYRMLPVGKRGTAKFAAIIEAMLANPDAARAGHGVPPFGTLSMLFGRKQLASAFRDHLHPLGIRDMIGINARDGGPWGITMSVTLPKERRVSAREAAPFVRLAGHVHAAFRIRMRLFGVPEVVEPSALVPSAVVSPGGELVHAEPEAQPFADSLKHAAVAIDRARARMRREDPEGALEAWRALVEGEWSLVETFESDGRRFLVARRNAPDAPRAAQLTDRERVVLGLRARSHGVKLIAYELGVSPASVSRALGSGMRKLGIASIGDLVRRGDSE